MHEPDSSRTSVLESPRPKASADLLAERRQELGQFLTPEPIGSFMASLFDAQPAEIRLLDAGAGSGALSAALVKRLCRDKRRPKRIAVTTYEIDREIHPALERTLQSCRAECARSGVEFSAAIEAGIEASNLYAGFLALAAKLLCENGEMVAICPRSFCNGPYSGSIRSKCSRSGRFPWRERRFRTSSFPSARRFRCSPARSQIAFSSSVQPGLRPQ